MEHDLKETKARLREVLEQYAEGLIHVEEARAKMLEILAKTKGYALIKILEIIS